jgi:hypothetical protein
MATTKSTFKPTKALTDTSPAVEKKTSEAKKTKLAIKKPTTKTAITKSVLAKPKSAKSSLIKPTIATEKKPKKPKLVRDSFTIPKDEYAALDILKTRAIALAQPAKKSELLRAGILLLAAMDDAHLLASLKAVTVIKTGRPKNVSPKK